MVQEEGTHRPVLRILVHALATRAVNPVMGLEDDGSAAGPARSAIPVDKVAVGGIRTAHEDSILAARGGPVPVVAATGAFGEEKVVKTAVLEHGRAFDGCVCRVVDQLCWSALGGGRRRATHLDLVDVAPETAKGEVVVTAGTDEVTVDGIVVPARAGLDTGGSKVRPSVGLHGGGAGNADGRVLRPEGAHGVVHIVLTADIRDIWGLACAEGVSQSDM